MFINRAKDGSNNLCGKAVSEKRKALGLSQRALADRLQLIGLDVDKNAVQRIEAGKRFVTDIELVALAQVLGLSPLDLLSETAAT
ncbi:MAG: helix-turn-helix transcriptional regulator [Oscillospiraceae bacterium]|nr:helix-turn-helix transcriptional regulator [Oscillospiraceae bacterium]